MESGLQVTIPPEEAESLIKLAKKQKLTPQEATLAAIKNYTFKVKWQAAQKAGQRIAKKLGIKTEEDIERLFN